MVQERQIQEEQKGQGCCFGSEAEAEAVDPSVDSRRYEPGEPPLECSTPGGPSVQAAGPAARPQVVQRRVAARAAEGAEAALR